MNKLYLIISTVILSIGFCLGQTTTTTGKYYEIGNTGLRAQFPGPPVESKTLDNEILKSVEYRYTFNEQNYAGNFMYAIGVYTVKIDSLSGDIQKQINFIANTTSIAFKNVPKTTVESFEESEFKGNYCVKFKANVFSPPANGMLIWNAIFFGHKKYVIYAYVQTSVQNDNNKDINLFFNSIQFN